MRKAIKYAGVGALTIGIGNALLNIINQLNEGEGKPINWQRVGIAGLKGAAFGGCGGFLIGSARDYSNGKEKPLNTDAKLAAVIADIRLDKDDFKYKKLSQKAHWLIDLIKSEYGEMLHGAPFMFGSTEKGTALKDSFDIDVCISFKAGSFSSTGKMYHNLDELMRSKIGQNGFIRIRNQPKSIRAIFFINGEEHKVDILPQKITAKRGNPSSGYIYVNPGGMFSKPSYTKTNPTLLKNIRLSEPQKKILVAIKDWKVRDGVPLNSHLLQYLIFDAYEYNKGHIPKEFTKKLVMTLRHIAKNIEIARIRSAENSNNILTEMPAIDKVAISLACKKVVEEYDYQPNSILKYFS